MTVVHAAQDLDALTLTLVSELAAPPSRVWQVWADPRQLERWWGPPAFPATFEEYEFAVGGRAGYVMTGPNGEKSRGWWRILALDEPHSLEFEDGFADQTGAPTSELGTTRARVELVEIPTGTRMTITSQFSSREQLEQMVGMGVVEGLTQAMDQIDGILAAG